MIRHYFKIAFRNLLKYKTQSIISIIGLAVGITCFALATLWIRYEMTYDTFHRRADDIYLVRAQLTITDGTLSNSMPYPAIEYLRKNISEIEDICGISPFKTNLRFKDKGGDLLAIEVDSAFIRMFDVRILQGNVNFLKKKSNEIAITEAVAKEWFGNESPLGKEIELGSRPCKVCAVVSGWSQHSNLSYGALLPARHHPSWQSNSEQIFVRILPDTDKSALQKRISSLDASSQEKESTLGKLNFTPITSLRYSDYLQKDEIVISFNYIRYFAMAGVLVIVCSLRVGARGTLSMALRCPGRTSSSFFSCKAGFSFPLEATGCCTGTVIPAPSSRSLSRISSCMRRISLSFPAVSAGSSVTGSKPEREADLLVFSFPTFWSMSSRVKLSLIRVLRITSPVSGSLLPEAGRLAMNAHTSRTTTIPKPASMAILLFPSRVIRARIVGHRYGRRNRTYFPESAEWHG